MRKGFIILLCIMALTGCQKDYTYTLKNNTSLQVVVNYYDDVYELSPGQTITIKHPLTVYNNFRITSPVSQRIKLEAEGFNYTVENVEPETLHILNLMPCDVTLKDTLHSDISRTIESNTTSTIQYYSTEQHDWSLDGAETDNTFNYIIHQSSRKYFLIDYDINNHQLVIRNF